MNIYQKLYERFYFSLFESFIKGRVTAKYYNNAQKSQWCEPDDIVFNQSMTLCKLLKHSSQFCPYYKKIINEHGTTLSSFTGIKDLLKFPILTKDVIKNNFDDLISTQHRNVVWKKSTGGSTGQPLHFAYTKESYEWRVAMSKRGYAWAGATPGARQAYIWGIQLGKVGRIKQMKEQLHHFIDRQLYFNCFEFDEKAMAQCLIDLNRFKPAAVVGYTNPLYNLALFVGDNSKIKFAPQGVICAAEKVHPYQREVIERVFGAKVFNTYGSREFMLIAAECEKHEGLHVSAENLIVEIIKDDGTPAKKGETGRIIVTDLHNYGMPFIRYEIGDLGIATSKACSCGRGLPLIADVVGRSLDVIRTPEGKIVPGEFFPHLMKDFSDIARFQVVQEKLDHLVIKLVPTTKLSEATKKRIDSEVRNVVGPIMVIKYEIVSDIPLTVTGKYRVTVSKLTGDLHG
jgi:phenylacetate-CoA ligase